MKNKNVKENVKTNSEALNTPKSKLSKKGALKNVSEPNSNTMQSKIYDSFHFAINNTKYFEGVLSSENIEPPILYKKGGSIFKKKGYCANETSLNLSRKYKIEVDERRSIFNNVSNENQPFIIESYFKKWEQQFSSAQDNMRNLACWNFSVDLILVNIKPFKNIFPKSFQEQNKCTDIATLEKQTDIIKSSVNTNVELDNINDRLTNYNLRFKNNKACVNTDSEIYQSESSFEHEIYDDSNDDDFMVKNSKPNKKTLKRKLIIKSEPDNQVKRFLTASVIKCIKSDDPVNATNNNVDNTVKENLKEIDTKGELMEDMLTDYEPIYSESKTEYPIVEKCPMCLKDVGHHDFERHVTSCVDEYEDNNTA